MKNKYLLMASATFALASCSSEEIVDLNREDEIKFRASVSYSTSTRGTETTTADFNKFYATVIDNSAGATYFPDSDEVVYALFEKDDDGYFVSKPPLKWSNTLSSIDIYAFGYTPKDGEEMEDDFYEGEFGEVTLNNDQQTINNFSPRRNIADQFDLVCAHGTGNILSVYEPIVLEFSHVLTEVQVVAKCDSKTHRVLVKGIKYGNIDNKANYNFGYNWWTEYRDKQDFELTYTTPINLNSTVYNHTHQGPNVEDNDYHDVSKSEADTPGSVGYAILLPQSLNTFSEGAQYWNVSEGKEPPSGKTKSLAQYIALLIKVNLIENGNVGAIKFPVEEKDQVPGTDGYGWAYIPLHLDKYPAWQMGNRYVYHLDLTDGVGYNEEGEKIIEGTIKFTASLGEWTSTNVDKSKP